MNRETAAQTKSVWSVNVHSAVRLDINVLRLKKEV